MKMRFFELAKKMSYKSDHEQHRIGGVLVKKNRVISLGFNKCRTHPKSNHVFKNTHTELDCILGVNPTDLNGSTLYLYRENKQGEIALSKPCRWCQELIKSSGISKVCYTDYGSYKEEEIA